ncbi:hypothetical protein [Streptomyces sp. VRA16 Mangrove soil]|uniref:hypothetical protein n=1 Tax=Streptomyces sp. VRA16 Mangrove soil TaxID=2817434 RepID=UPI001A9EDBA5|nr:hypothetical protein [Streptomyces sp. VRA16 Mangrove soil]MBO1332112.1 hypothetical protein [Streptomyces sp. VRA16 Mangrove soil]
MKSIAGAGAGALLAVVAAAGSGRATGTAMQDWAADWWYVCNKSLPNSPDSGA